jgi:nucleotide-binding universal stress UspA family protein
MIERILVAVDDSAAGLAAARFAVALAAAVGARVRAVTVVGDGVTNERLIDARGTPESEPDVAMRRAAAARAVLVFVAGLAERLGVPHEEVRADGEVGAAVLAEAAAQRADLIVLGRAGLTGAGEPRLGWHARHILELSERPVLMVPSRR